MPPTSTPRNGTDKARWAAIYSMLALLATAQGYAMVSPNARPNAYTSTQAAADRAADKAALVIATRNLTRELATITDAAILMANKFDLHLALRMHSGAEVAIVGLRSDLKYIRETLVEIRDRLKNEE